MEKRELSMEKKKFVNEVVYLTSDEIMSAFAQNDRQYLQGNLKREQELPYIHNENSEIGISYYREFSYDDVHYHEKITETNYILEGKIGMKIVDTGEEFVVEQGGIFSIPPKVPHIMKAKPETKIIFFKDYAANDKRIVDMDMSELKEWLEDKEF